MFAFKILIALYAAISGLRSAQAIDTHGDDNRKTKDSSANDDNQTSLRGAKDGPTFAYGPSEFVRRFLGRKVEPRKLGCGDGERKWHPSYHAGWRGGYCRLTVDCNSPGYNSELECCRNAFGGQSSGECLSRLPNPPTLSPTGAGGLDFWYPNYDEVRSEGYCVNDRPSWPPGSRPTYKSMLECCNSAYADQASGKCLSMIPNPPNMELGFYYADRTRQYSNGICTNTGPIPHGVTTYKSHELCCASAYPSQTSLVCVCDMNPRQSICPTVRPSKNNPTKRPTSSLLSQESNASTDDTAVSKIDGSADSIAALTDAPTRNPTGSPTDAPTGNPTESPTDAPTGNPTGNPTNTPTGNQTGSPTNAPTGNPNGIPTDAPTGNPIPPTMISSSPTQSPTSPPSTSSVCTDQDSFITNTGSTKTCSWVADNLAIRCGKYSQYCPVTCGTC